MCRPYGWVFGDGSLLKTGRENPVQLQVMYPPPRRRSPPELKAVTLPQVRTTKMSIARRNLEVKKSLSSSMRLNSC